MTENCIAPKREEGRRGVCHGRSVDVRTQGEGQEEERGTECVKEKGDDEMRSGGDKREKSVEKERGELV